MSQETETLLKIKKLLSSTDIEKAGQEFKRVESLEANKLLLKILEELKKTNMYLSEMTDLDFDKEF